MQTSALVERYRDAAADTRRQIDRLLEQDADDQAWAQQLGPVYRQHDVARLLGKSKQAGSADPGLLKLEMRNGQVRPAATGGMRVRPAIARESPRASRPLGKEPS